MSARRIAVTVLVASFALGAGPAAAADRSVSIKDNKYLPHRLIALSGETVTWTNDETVVGRTHNIVADAGLFTSPILGAGQTYPWTFASPGVVSYHCTIHPMHGVVAVYDLYFSVPQAAVLYGKNAALSGYATEGATVDIMLVEDVGPPSLVTSVTVDPVTGKFSTSILAVPGTYFAQTTSPAHTSANLKLQVKPKLAVTKKRKGNAYWITASTTPNQQGANMVLERKKGFGWKKLATHKLGATSKTVFKVVPTAKWSVRLRLAKPVGGYAPATSGILGLRP